MALDKESIEARITVLENQLLNDRDTPDFERPGRYIMHIYEIKAMKYCLEHDVETIQQRIRDLRKFILQMDISKMDHILVLMNYTLTRNILKEVIKNES